MRENRRLKLLPGLSAVVAYGLSPRLSGEIESRLRAVYPGIRFLVWTDRQTLAQVLEPCLLFPVPSAEEAQFANALFEVCALFPQVLKIALFSDRESCSKTVLRLGACGVHHVVPVDKSVRDGALEEVLEHHGRRNMASRVWQESAITVPEEMVIVLIKALRVAFANATVEQFAKACGVHARTLRKKCEVWGTIEPQWILGWARLLVASYYLRDPGRRMSDVAELLGFPSATALGNYFKRYTTLSVRQLRALGIFRTVTESMQAALVGAATRGAK